MANDARLVYSSAHGRICPECSQPQASCRCRKAVAPSSTDGVIRVRRESKGRGGKTVTVVTGVPLAAEALKTLAGELKHRCGTGGTLKDGTIEIQGDHVELLIGALSERGFRVKRAGG